MKRVSLQTRLKNKKLLSKVQFGSFGEHEHRSASETHFPLSCAKFEFGPKANFSLTDPLTLFLLEKTRLKHTLFDVDDFALKYRSDGGDGSNLSFKFKNL